MLLARWDEPMTVTIMLCDTQMFNGAELARNKTPIQQRTTTMKEIVYIQAGNISNYVGTHFWNTQETYLSNTGSKETLDVDPDVSMMDSSHDEVFFYGSWNIQLSPDFDLLHRTSPHYVRVYCFSIRNVSVELWINRHDWL